ncbi:MAG TPA: hypothetical protein VJN22_07845 [Candidatus Eremiobacteraceae bacterium]|nr:hypothetical protein [Candidatus Eremiobacteraceae bacterium]
MSSTQSNIALTFVVAIVMLIAPAVLVTLVLARPPLARAAATYGTHPDCANPAALGLPQPARPIPLTMRNGQPCAITGAMVSEKDTVSQGIASVTHYALGLRTDAGAEFVATLDGADAESLWSSTQPGDRVAIQTFDGRVALVGDGARTVRTSSNPESAARSNALGLWIAGVICALEVLSVWIIIAWRRTISTENQSVDA